MQEPMLSFRPRHDYGLGGRHAGDALSLERRQHGPPDLVDRLTPPGPLPGSVIPGPPITFSRSGRSCSPHGSMRTALSLLTLRAS